MTASVITRLASYDLQGRTGRETGATVILIVFC